MPKRLNPTNPDVEVLNLITNIVVYMESEEIQSDEFHHAALFDEIRSYITRSPDHAIILKSGIETFYKWKLDRLIDRHTQTDYLKWSAVI